MNDLYIDLRLFWITNFDIRFNALIRRYAFLHISNIKSNFNESFKAIPNTRITRNNNVILYRKGIDWQNFE